MRFHKQAAEHTHNTSTTLDVSSALRLFEVDAVERRLLHDYAQHLASGARDVQHGAGVLQRMVRAIGVVGVAAECVHRRVAERDAVVSALWTLIGKRPLQIRAEDAAISIPSSTTRLYPGEALLFTLLLCAVHQHNTTPAPLLSLKDIETATGHTTHLITSCHSTGYALFFIEGVLQSRLKRNSAPEVAREEEAEVEGEGRPGYWRCAASGQGVFCFVVMGGGGGDVYSALRGHAEVSGEDPQTTLLPGVSVAASIQSRAEKLCAAWTDLASNTEYFPRSQGGCGVYVTGHATAADVAAATVLSLRESYDTVLPVAGFYAFGSALRCFRGASDISLRSMMPPISFAVVNMHDARVWRDVLPEAISEHNAAVSAVLPLFSQPQGDSQTNPEGSAHSEDNSSEGEGAPPPPPPLLHCLTENEFFATVLSHEMSPASPRRRGRGRKMDGHGTHGTHGRAFAVPESYASTQANEHSGKLGAAASLRGSTTTDKTHPPPPKTNPLIIVPMRDLFHGTLPTHEDVASLLHTTTPSPGPIDVLRRGLALRASCLKRLLLLSTRPSAVQDSTVGSYAQNLLACLTAAGGSVRELRLTPEVHRGGAVEGGWVEEVVQKLFMSEELDVSGFGGGGGSAVVYGVCPRFSVGSRAQFEGIFFAAVGGWCSPSAGDPGAFHPRRRMSSAELTILLKLTDKHIATHRISSLCPLSLSSWLSLLHSEASQGGDVAWLGRMLALSPHFESYLEASVRGMDEVHLESCFVSVLQGGGGGGGDDVNTARPHTAPPPSGLGDGGDAPFALLQYSEGGVRQLTAEGVAIAVRLYRHHTASPTSTSTQHSTSHSLQNIVNLCIESHTGHKTALFPLTAEIETEAAFVTFFEGLCVDHEDIMLNAVLRGGACNFSSKKGVLWRRQPAQGVSRGGGVGVGSGCADAQGERLSRIVSLLGELQCTTVEVLQAIQKWREHLTRPFPFRQRTADGLGCNVIFTMIHDCIDLTMCLKDDLPARLIDTPTCAHLQSLRRLTRTKQTRGASASLFALKQRNSVDPPTPPPRKTLVWADRYVLSEYLTQLILSRELNEAAEAGCFVCRLRLPNPLVSVKAFTARAHSPMEIAKNPFIALLGSEKNPQLAHARSTSARNTHIQSVMNCFGIDEHDMGTPSTPNVKAAELPAAQSLEEQVENCQYFHHLGDEGLRAENLEAVRAFARAVEHYKRIFWAGEIPFETQVVPEPPRSPTCVACSAKPPHMSPHEEVVMCLRLQQNQQHTSDVLLRKTTLLHIRIYWARWARHHILKGRMRAVQRRARVCHVEMRYDTLFNFLARRKLLAWMASRALLLERRHFNILRATHYDLWTAFLHRKRKHKMAVAHLATMMSLSNERLQYCYFQTLQGYPAFAKERKLEHLTQQTWAHHAQHRFTTLFHFWSYRKKCRTAATLLSHINQAHMGRVYSTLCRYVKQRRIADLLAHETVDRAALDSAEREQRQGLGEARLEGVLQTVVVREDEARMGVCREEKCGRAVVVDVALDAMEALDAAGLAVQSVLYRGGLHALVFADTAALCTATTLLARDIGLHQQGSMATRGVPALLSAASRMPAMTLLLSELR